MKKSRSQSTAGRGKTSTARSNGRANGTGRTATSAASTRKSSSNGTAKKSGTPASRSKAASASSNGRSTRSTTTATRSKKASTAQDDLMKVFKDGLKDIYYAEKQLMKALNKMSKSASNLDLKEAFDMHKQETQQQIERLDEAFEALGMRAAGKKCPAMDGLIEEGAEAMEEFDKGPARDAALIMSAQKAEHYEIASYGSLRAFARTLGESECEEIFDEILQQESATDEKLTQIAMTVNEEATAEGQEEAEMEMAH